MRLFCLRVLLATLDPLHVDADLVDRRTATTAQLHCHSV